jgi:FkbM family methyltransferase
VPILASFVPGYDHRMSTISFLRSRIFPLVFGWIPDSVLFFLDKEIQIQLGKGWGSTTTSREAAAIAHFVKRKNLHEVVALDVGANLGNWSLNLLEVVPSAKIIAFEPSQEAFKKLSQRFASDKNVQCVNLALGKIDSEAILFSNESASGWASLTKRRLEHFDIEFNLTEIVTVSTLDNWINHIERKIVPNILKMDVEGHELDVLQGAEQTLNNVEIIQFEFGGCNIDTRTFLQDFWYLLSERGFELFRLTPRGIKLITKYTENDEVFSTTNFVAVRK